MRNHRECSKHSPFYDWVQGTSRSLSAKISQMMWAGVLILHLSFSMGERSQALASTFIGNGGDQAFFMVSRDREALLNILENISPEDKSRICVCSSNNPSRSCGVLADISEEQIRFCREEIYLSRGALVGLLESRSELKIRLEEGPIFADEGDDKPRPVDAVTNPGEGAIILDRERYLEMAFTDRLSLLAHELFHLVKRSDGETWRDEGEAGPFEGESGGRKALDALGAALASLDWELGFQSAEESQLSTVGWKRHYIRIAERSLIGAGRDLPKGLLISRRDSYTEFGYAHDWRPLTFDLSLSSAESNGVPAPGVETVFTDTQFRIGTAYRSFPVAGINGWFSQFNLSLGVGSHVSSQHWEITDGDTSIKMNPVAYGGDARILAHIPLFWELWLSTGLFVLGEKWVIKNLGVDEFRWSHGSYLGVDYGF